MVDEYLRSLWNFLTWQPVGKYWEKLQIPTGDPRISEPSTGHGYNYTTGGCYGYESLQRVVIPCRWPRDSFKWWPLRFGVPRKRGLKMAPFVARRIGRYWWLWCFKWVQVKATYLWNWGGGPLARGRFWRLKLVFFKCSIYVRKIFWWGRRSHFDWAFFFYPLLGSDIHQQLVNKHWYW